MVLQNIKEILQDYDFYAKNSDIEILAYIYAYLSNVFKKNAQLYFEWIYGNYRWFYIYNCSLFLFVVFELATLLA